MAATDPFAALNAPQRRAVTFGQPLADGKGVQSGPLLVVAGAGTGKTETIAHRVAWLVMNGVDPARILLLTFTRRAADADAPARARHHAPGAGRHARQQGAGDAAAAGVGRHLSLDRQPAAAPLRAPPQPRSRLHGHRPARFGRSVRQPAPGARSSASSSSAFRARTPAWRSTPGASTRKRACARRSSSSSSWCLNWEQDLAPAVPRLRRAQAALAACSTTTTC